MEKGKKCPNCGYISTENQDFCPQCDQFETQVFQPLTDEKIAVLNAEKLEKEALKLKQQRMEAISEIDEKTVEDLSETKIIAVATPPLGMPEIKSEEVSVPETPVVESGISQESEASAVERLPQGEETIDRFERPQVVEARKIVAKAEKKAPNKPTKSNSEKDTTNTPSAKGKRNRILALIVLLLLIAGGGYFGYHKVQANRKAEIAANLEKEVKLLSIEAEKLYLDSEHIFLSESFQQSELTALEDKASELGPEADVADLTDLLSDLNSRSAKQTAVNDLFETPIIVGSNLTKDAVIKSTVDQIPATSKENGDAFADLLNQGLEEAEKQLKATEKADKLVAALFSENKVSDKATAELLKSAKESVAALKDSKIKETYSDQLETVTEELKKRADKKAEEEAKKQAEAAQVAANQQASSNKAANNGPATNYSDANNTPYGAGQGITTQANKDTINYVNVPEEGAWAWAPGVKEGVIAESLRRGYIVEGGYVLKQKEVINGEGYYDLYATTTASSLLSGRSEKELPIYLVTINAKTGSFKGEGPN